jgi:NAD(P)-dependent dehydrogenase (short-subunit alcohol dehydrogenase family)
VASDCIAPPPPPHQVRFHQPSHFTSNLPAEGYVFNIFSRLIDINLTGTFIVAQAVGNAMIKTNTPRSMIFIAPMLGHIVNWPQSPCNYNASKAGVIMFRKSLATEWAPYQIRVNTISPGYMDTALNCVPELDAQNWVWIERTPMERLGDVDETMREVGKIDVLVASAGISA